MKNLASLIIVIFFPLFVFSQKPAPKPTPRVFTEKEQKLLAQKLQAVSMVEKTAEEAVFWEDKKAAIEALADAADLLWHENAGQSAKWLTKAWKMIDEVTESPKNERMREFFSSSDKTNLQTAVLRVAQKHDELLAEKLLKQLTDRETEEKNEKKDRGAFDDKSARSEQLLRLAQQSVETNPTLAVTLAERSLIDGISFGLQNVLTSLRQKDAGLANRLFDAALARFNAAAADTSEAQILVGYLFKPGFTMATNSSGGTILVVNPAQQNLPGVAQSEPLRAKNLLGAIYQTFFARQILINVPENKKRAEDVMLLGNRVVGYYDKFAPELAQPTRLFLTQLQTQLYPNRNNQSPGSNDRSSNLPKNATDEERYEASIDDLEEKADRETDPIAKKIAYVKAALNTKSEDYKRGARIAEKIDDENLREDAVSFVLYRAALYFVQKKEIETAEELAAQIKHGLRSAIVRIAAAQALLQAKTDGKVEQLQIESERRRAFDLLGEVQKNLSKEDVSANSVKTMFGRTAVLARFDKTQSFNSLEEAIYSVNKLKQFNLKDASAPRLSLDLSASSGATVAVPRLGFGFESAIEPLIESDYEQIATVVERISARETRGGARLAAAKLFFQKNKDSLAKLS